MENAGVARETNRRDNPRVSVTRPVVLNHAKMGADAGWIKDVSLDGAFVQSKWKDLPAFSAVEITVTLSTGEEHKAREYRLPATVARCTEDGVGLKFDHLNMESYSVLLDLLYSN
ncbi:MAG: PilZ domain-containing protein [Acidiferrobacterales bacterium]